MRERWSNSVGRDLARMQARCKVGGRGVRKCLHPSDSDHPCPVAKASDTSRPNSPKYRPAWPTELATSGPMVEFVFASGGSQRKKS
jgi:hypothetical protein